MNWEVFEAISITAWNSVNEGHQWWQVSEGEREGWYDEVRAVLKAAGLNPGEA